MPNFDQYVNGIMAGFSQAHPIIRSMSLTMASPVGTMVMLGLMTLIVIGLGLRYGRQAVMLMLTALGSTGLILWSLKWLFMRLRPDNALIILNDPSFPSGHASFAAVFCAIMGYLLLRRFHSDRARLLIFAGGILITLIIGLSRLILNVHWASDVIVGWALGIAVAIPLIYFMKFIMGRVKYL